MLRGTHGEALSREMKWDWSDTVWYGEGNGCNLTHFIPVGRRKENWRKDGLWNALGKVCHGNELGVTRLPPSQRKEEGK